MSFFIQHTLVALPPFLPPAVQLLSILQPDDSEARHTTNGRTSRKAGLDLHWPIGYAGVESMVSLPSLARNPASGSLSPLARALSQPNRRRSMSDFVHGTCDVTGRESDACIVTRWYAAKEQGIAFERESAYPSGWGKTAFSDLTSFEIYVSRDLIRRRARAQLWLIGIAFTLGILFSVILPLAIPNTMVTQSICLSWILIFRVALGIAGFFWLVSLLGFKPRYLTWEPLSGLKGRAEKRLAWSLSNRIAWK